MCLRTSVQFVPGAPPESPCPDLPSGVTPISLRMRGLPSTARAQGAPSPWRAGTLGPIPRQSPYKQR